MPIDITLSEHQEPTNEQPNYNYFIQTWKARMREAFKIAEENTKKNRSADKRQMGLKATLEPLEVGGRVLVRNLIESRDLEKFAHFGNKIYIDYKKRKTKMD